MAPPAESRRRVLAVLMILAATCETTLNTLQVADNPVDAELTGLLEKMIERTRLEMEALSEEQADSL